MAATAKALFFFLDRIEVCVFFVLFLFAQIALVTGYLWIFHFMFFLACK